MTLQYGQSWSSCAMYVVSLIYHAIENKSTTKK